MEHIRGGVWIVLHKESLPRLCCENLAAADTTTTHRASDGRGTIIVYRKERCDSGWEHVGGCLNLPVFERIEQSLAGAFDNHVDLFKTVNAAIVGIRHGCIRTRLRIEFTHQMDFG